MADKIIPQEYEAAANNVYRFNIPIPPHRSADDKIAIEHYLTDENLATVDKAGKKIFLAKDFDSKGISLDGKYMRQHAKDHNSSKYDPLEIVNGTDDKRVYRNVPDDNENYAMTKDNLVTHISNADKGFNFDLSAFELILVVIKKIVEHADAAMEKG